MVFTPRPEPLCWASQFAFNDEKDNFNYVCLRASVVANLQLQEVFGCWSSVYSGCRKFFQYSGWLSACFNRCLWFDAGFVHVGLDRRNRLRQHHCGWGECNRYEGLTRIRWYESWCREPGVEECFSVELCGHHPCEFHHGEQKQDRFSGQGGHFGAGFVLACFLLLWIGEVFWRCAIGGR